MLMTISEAFFIPFDKVFLLKARRVFLSICSSVSISFGFVPLLIVRSIFLLISSGRSLVEGPFWSTTWLCTGFDTIRSVNLFGRQPLLHRRFKYYL